jgi:hypothetical protein
VYVLPLLADTRLRFACEQDCEDGPHADPVFVCLIDFWIGCFIGAFVGHSDGHTGSTRSARRRLVHSLSGCPEHQIPTLKLLSCLCQCRFLGLGLCLCLCLCLCIYSITSRPSPDAARGSRYTLLPVHLSLSLSLSLTTYACACTEVIHQIWEVGSKTASPHNFVR